MNSQDSETNILSDPSNRKDKSMKTLKVLRVAAIMLIIAVLLPSVVFTADSSLPFKDVKNGKWYYAPIKYVFDNGIMNGMTKDTFVPEGTTTRAQLVTILSRLDGAEIKGKGADTGFSDVPAGKWYSDAIGWAAEKNLVNGYNDGTFKPDAPILRQELAVLLDRFIVYRSDVLPDNPIADGFSDQKQIPKWAAGSVEKIRLCGIIAGDKAGNFNPKKTATRAEIATMIERYLKNVEDPMFSKFDQIYDLTEGEGKRVNIHLLLRERITGSGTPFSLSAQILPQLGLDTDTYEIIIDRNCLDDLIAVTDCNMLGDALINVDWKEQPENQGISRFKIKNIKTGEETANKTIVLNVIRSTGPLEGMDPEEFDPAISSEVYEEMKRIARYSLGDPARYAAFIDKAERGEPVTVAYIGGSITRGASGGPYHNWTRLMQNWLEKTFPQSEMTFVNAGIDGTGSDYGNIRLVSNVLDHEPDLFFIEFALNDGWANKTIKDGFESMVRRVLSSEKKPAIMILLVGFAGEEMCSYDKLVADHYGISVADYCAAAKYAMDVGEVYSREIAYDGAHPREWGHNFMAQTLVLNFRAIMEEIKTASPEELVIKDIPTDRISEAINEDLKSDRPLTYTPESMGNWKVVNNVYKFTNGWQCEDTTSEFVYEFTGKTLYILGGHSDGPDYPETESTSILVSVDGGEFKQYDCDRYARVISENEVTTHRLVIKAADEGSTTTITEFVYN